MIRFWNISLMSCNFFIKLKTALKTDLHQKQRIEKNLIQFLISFAFFPEKTEWKKQDEGNCKIPFWGRQFWSAVEREPSKPPPRSLYGNTFPARRNNITWAKVCTTDGRLNSPENYFIRARTHVAYFVGSCRYFFVDFSAVLNSRGSENKPFWVNPCR